VILAVIVVRKGNTKIISIDIGGAVGVAAGVIYN